MPKEDLNSSYINNVNINTYFDDKGSTIQLIVESDKIFFNPKIFLHSPFGLPVVKNTINYSSDNKIITAYFNFDILGWLQFEAISKNW